MKYILVGLIVLAYFILMIYTNWIVYEIGKAKGYQQGLEWILQEDGITTETI